MAGGFVVVAQVESEVRFNEYIAAVEVSVNKALVEWANLALREIRAAETRVGTASPTRAISPGIHLRDTFRTLVQKSAFSSFGAMISIWTADPNAIWQELGTRGRRHGTLKRGGKNETTGNRGVTPLFFMRNGFARAYPAGIALVESALQGLGDHTAGAPNFDTMGSSSLLGSGTAIGTGITQFGGGQSVRGAGGRFSA